MTKRKVDDPVKFKVELRGASEIVTGTITKIDIDEFTGRDRFKIEYITTLRSEPAWKQVGEDWFQKYAL